MVKNEKPIKKRPAPERAHPQRRFDAMFGPPDPHRETGRDEHDERDEDGERERVGPIVNDAYRVAEKPYRRGYHFAEKIGAKRRHRPAADRQVFELAGVGARAISQMVALWADLLIPFLPRALTLGRPGAGRLPRHDEDEERGRYDRDDELRVSVEVTSSRPVTVSLKLDRGLSPEVLHVPSLRLDGSKETKLVGVTIEVEEDDRVTVRVAIPDDQPAGTYKAPVRTADRLGRLGRLRVVVRDTAGEPAS